MSDTILYWVILGSSGTAIAVFTAAAWLLAATKHDNDEPLGETNVDLDLNTIATDIENVLDGLEKVLGFADSNLGFLIGHIPNGKQSLEVTKTIVEGVNEVVGKLAESSDDSE